MPWSRGGTVAVTQNSTTVTGTGTGFVASGRVGDAFLGPDGRWYEVTNIASDTALSILPAYQGPAVNGGVYALAPMQGYVKQSADALRALVNQFGAKLAALGTTGNYDILPVEKGGTGTNSLSTFARSGANSDITQITGLTTQLSSDMGGNGGMQFFITGLKISKATGGRLGIDTGAAYIPALGRILTVPAQILFQMPNNMLPGYLYHIYLYANGNTPAIDFVIAPNGPPVPYAYPAYMMQGNPSRRYIGSVLAASATDCVNFTMNGNRIEYQANNTSGPLQVLALGQSTSTIGVSCAAVVPPTAQQARCLMYNRETGSGPLVRIGNSLIGDPASSSRSFVLPSNAFESEVLLDSVQSFYYSYAGVTPSTGFTVRVLGYTFER